MVNELEPINTTKIIVSQRLVGRGWGGDLKITALVTYPCMNVHNLSCSYLINIQFLLVRQGNVVV